MSPSHSPLRLTDLFEAGRPPLLAQYGSRLQPHQWQAMTAIEACRTEQLGQIHRQCPDCGTTGETTRSCGHRSCPACQNHTTTQWLERQQAKRLPVDYFMVTFTLAAALRALAIADFLWRVLLHVLPTGFRRVRDYGFLHGNAKRRLALVQLVLRVWITNPAPRARPPVCCPVCHTPMVIIRITHRARPDP